MRPLTGIKRIVDKKGNRLYITTDGRTWNQTSQANPWQKKLNKVGVKVNVKVSVKVKTASTIKPKLVSGKAGKSYHGKGGNVGVSPEKRRAMKAFIIKHNISAGTLRTGNVISMNRLLWAVGSNRKALNDFVELFAIP